MEKVLKSKEIMVRLQKNSKPYELAIKNGFLQQKNGVDIPNVNKMMNYLYVFAEKLDLKGVNLKALHDERILEVIKNHK
jgi:hypothetical protein